MNVLTVLAKKEVFPPLLEDKVYESLVSSLLELTEIAYRANAPAYMLSCGEYNINYEYKVKEYSSEVIFNPKELKIPWYLDYTHLNINDGVLIVKEDVLVIPIDYKILYICDKHS